MPVRIIDASALGALAFGEPKAWKIASALEDATAAAPELLRYEMASICLKKIRAHPQQMFQILEAFSLSGRLAIQTMEVQHPEVVMFARDAGLTTYDASYLWLAATLQGELITLDPEMLEAAARLNISHV